MPTAMEVARYLLHLSTEEPEPELITHLRLQKLLYYCQAWSMAMRDEPLFAESIEAWVHGPVVPAVFPLFADYGKCAIPAREADPGTGFRANDRVLIESVWERYKKYSATELRRMTHAELPWLEARGDAAPDERTDKPIALAAMQEYYAAEYDLVALPRLDTASLRQSREQIQRGEGVTLADYIAQSA